MSPGCWATEAELRTPARDLPWVYPGQRGQEKGMARESGQGSGGKGDGKKVLGQRRQDRKMARETGQKA